MKKQEAHGAAGNWCVCGFCDPGHGPTMGSSHRPFATVITIQNQGGYRVFPAAHTGIGL